MAQAGTLDGRVSALEARTGDVLWSLDTGGGMVSSYQVSSRPPTILFSVSVESTSLNASTHTAKLIFLFSLAERTQRFFLENATVRRRSWYNFSDAPVLTLGVTV